MMPHAPGPSSDVISLTRVRELDLDAPSQPGRPAYLSAASGLVRCDDTLYVIADDEVHLGIFSLDTTAPGRLLRLRSSSLPLEPHARKRAKLDFEALVHIPSCDALLALGSGSTPRRMEAIWIELDPDRQPKQPRSFDFTPLYGAIESVVDEVNIEGAVVRGGELLLFQRGNRGRGINAVLSVDLSFVLDAIATGSGMSSAPTIRLIQQYDLGAIGAVPLGFSDAAALPDGSLIFSAIAENATNAYEDGAFTGAAIGIIDVHGAVSRVRRIAPPAKIEGIHAEARGDKVELLAVTDADDARVPAVLYAATLTFETDSESAR